MTGLVALTVGVALTTHGGWDLGIVEHMFDFLAGLNAEQRAAATFEGDGPLRILAGAGTGKTTALASRVAWLVASGMPAERILLLTFTRRAAREMLPAPRRCSPGPGDGAAGPGPGRHLPLGRPPHAAPPRHRARPARGFSVLDTADAADVIDLVRDEHGAVEPDAAPVPAQGAAARPLLPRRSTPAQPLSDVIAEVAPWCADLHRADRRDLPGLRRTQARARPPRLRRPAALLACGRGRPDRSARSSRPRSTTSCVDEYQDVNALQVDVLRGAARHRPPAHRRRRRRPGGLRVPRRRARATCSTSTLVFPASTTIPLETQLPLVASRSSTSPTRSARDAPEGFMAVLRAAEPAASDGDRPQLVRCADEDAQVDAVCERVLAHREAGIALREQAVLVRAAHHSDLLELELSPARASRT